jgi:hypothetical protein
MTGRADGLFKVSRLWLTAAQWVNQLVPNELDKLTTFPINVDADICCQRILST